MPVHVMPGRGPEIPMAVETLPVIWALQALRPKTPQWAIDLIRSVMACLLQDIHFASFDDLAVWTSFDRSDLETLLGSNTPETRAGLVAIEALVPGMLKNVGVGAYRAIQAEGGLLRWELYGVAAKAKAESERTGGKDGVGLEGAILDQNGYPIDTGHMPEALETVEIPTVRDPDPADDADWTSLASLEDAMPS